MNSISPVVDSTNATTASKATIKLVEEFYNACGPIERPPLLLLKDSRTGALFAECHVPADKICSLGTIDVPLDPDEQSDYRANRDIVEDHVAFERMKDDALANRAFSNIVCEYTTTFDPIHPIKIIGGQHRFEAIKQGLQKSINEHHGLKIYFGLDNEQRLDVQLISNTNIAVSSDLFDRMHETLAGPGLRDWCQAVGLLRKGEDFADRRVRGNPITVRAARTFILNYFLGTSVNLTKFSTTLTTPIISKSGAVDEEWTNLKAAQSDLWTNKGLMGAGKAFAKLVASQRAAFAPIPGSRKKSGPTDYADKALNFAVLSAWAFVAGVLSNNAARRKRHYDLANTIGKDPLNAAQLAKGRHKTDPENYRGLGYRTDAKERGRMTELFYLQAEDGSGISAVKIDLAIKKFHAKEAVLDVQKSSK